MDQNAFEKLFRPHTHIHMETMTLTTTLSTAAETKRKAHVYVWALSAQGESNLRTQKMIGAHHQRAWR